jgi:hydroxypyruvate reductase
LSDYDGIFVVAFGKAADSMANIVAHLTHITGGLVVIPKNTASLLKNNNFKILKAGHPLPDKSSVSAAKTIIKFLQARKNNDYVIFLISGGGSSLVALPDGITLSEKKKTTKLLLDCGADIHEINCIRKHISKIKGGWMSEYLKCDAISLVMSDVVGNDISSIASGPTYFDKTTFDDAKKILKKYNLEKSVPKNVLKRIVRGMKNKIPETPKHPKIKNYVIATNGNCLDEMKKTAKKFGLRTSVVSSIDDDVKLAARKLIAKTKPNSCLVFGGETTVKVTGHGKGGRNQELVLYASIDSYKKNHKTIIASIGTDGKDGNTNACGAMLENSELKIGETQKFLKNNNSYSLLKKHNALVFTGQTHTNLMDIGVILRK